MKAIKVFIEQFKCLDNFEAKLNGDNVVLLADNGRGKSTFLQFLQIALGNSDIIPPNTNGKGHVIIDKKGNKYTLNVKIKDGKSVVEIVTDDGLKDIRKGTLGGLVGAMSFDINAFVEMSKTKKGQKEQVEIFKAFLPEEVRSELLRMEAHVQTIYNERTEVNREKDRITKVIVSHPLINVNTSQYKLPDMKAILDRKDKLKVDLNKQYLDNKEENGRRRNEWQSACEELAKSIEKHNKLVEQSIKDKDEAELINDQLKKLGYTGNEVTDFIFTLKNKIQNIKQYIPIKEPEYVIELPSDEPMKAIDLEISGAQEATAKYNSAQELEKLKQEQEKLINEAGELTVRIDTEKEAISNAIKDMANPVPGLSFNEESLLYNNIPVNPDSLSTSEIIELGIKLKMAENPELGILFIEHGESLGK